MRIFLFLLLTSAASYSWGQISLTTIGSSYTQNFNTLVNTLSSSTLPSGWSLTETGTGSNSVYTAGTGSGNTGDTYSFGTTGNTDRAFGGVQSGSVIPIIGGSFTNNTGVTFTSLDIAYIGEQWRLGALGRVDRIDFQYSLNATSLTTGTWTDFNSLDFTSPITTGAIGALDGNFSANRTSISSSITGLSISNSATFWIRWTDLNATGSDDGLSIDDFSLVPFSNITNSISSGAITGSPFTVDCTTDGSGSIAFTSLGTFNAGNIYTAQLSNAAGSFASPINIGTLSSTANAGSINILIPATMLSGTGYLIRIVASDPVTTGNSSIPFTINLTGGPCTPEPPHLTSVIINSCTGLCTEGNNEVIFGTSGDYSFDVNTTNFDFLYGPTYPGTNYTDALVNNATRINELNTAAGCGSLFIDANGGNIPSNSNWMLASTNICEEALSWSGLCGLGPIYVIFQNDTDWNSGGNFANSPPLPGTRFYQTSITSIEGSNFTLDYTTDGSYPDSDGVFASFGADGGAAKSYGDDNCILQPVLLPTGLIAYNGEIINSQSHLAWQTNSEQNNDYFTISHSTTGYDFQIVGQIQGAGNSSTLSNYKLLHERPSQGINYYKLTSTDFNGTIYTKGIVSLLFNSSGCYFDSQTREIKFNELSDYRIFSMDGKLLGEALNETSILFNQQGIVLIQDLRSGLTERLFIP